MKKFNKSKVIIPALAMIALTTAASATGTVAWFSANQAATVTGMKFKTAVDSNLLVAGTTDGSTAIAYNTAAIAKEAQFAETYEFSANAVNLTPASTVNATAFFTTSKAKADGSAIVNGNTTTYLSATNGTSIYYYVDYSFELKAVATENSTIELTKLNLLYGTPASTYGWGTKAWRIALFVNTVESSNIEDSTTAFGTGNPTLHGIYTPASCANQTTGQAVSSVSALSDVDYLDEAKSIASLTASKTYYTRVTARIWLEGEDTTCTNEDFLSLTADWSLDMKFAIGGTGVKNIGSAV